jgi:hypothetical protein
MVVARRLEKYFTGYTLVKNGDFMRKCTSKIQDFRMAANQEHVWSDSAMNEYTQEKRRAIIARKHGYKTFAKELDWDVRMCKLWHDMREQREKHYLKHIKQLKRSK